MSEVGKVDHDAAEELPRGLHLHHHLSPRRERAMFATLGFTVALVVTRGITTLLHSRGAGPNGGIVVGGVHIHHFVFGMVGLLLLAYLWLLLDVYWKRQGRESVDALAIFGGFLLWAALIAPFALAVWRHLTGRPLPPPRR